MEEETSQDSWKESFDGRLKSGGAGSVLAMATVGNNESRVQRDDDELACNVSARVHALARARPAGAS